MGHVNIQKKNEVYLQLSGDIHILYELADRFTFDVPGAQFSPAYKKRYWDGKIRLMNVQNGEIYVGLLDKVIAFLNKHEYSYSFIDNKHYGMPFEINEM